MLLSDRLFFIFIYIFFKCLSHFSHCGPASPGNFTRAWPYMKNHDIWGNQKTTIRKLLNNHYSINNNNNNNNNNDNKLNSNSINIVRDNFDKNLHLPYNNKQMLSSIRDPKVLNFFPVPVDDECISDDGRRSGVCFNVYECRIQGGTSRGQCALGFGVCCVFTATCDQEIFNNITYFVSPSFPAIMSGDIQSCKLKIKMISPDISQLRLDFVHFSLGQPNRMSGYCDGDIFTMNGGTNGDFNLCGHNHGQHIYYDVPGNTVVNATVAKGRQNLPINNEINILMNFTNRLFQNRLWEIKVTQIPFSQRAPAGCLQYFFGNDGIIQTFNFAENGRHLANQEYRSCIRQETGMCSIAYEPCDEQSFKIGPNQSPQMDVAAAGGGATAIDGIDAPIAPYDELLSDLPVVMEPENVQNDLEEVASNAVTEAIEPVSSTIANDEPVVEGSGGGDADDDFTIFPGFFSSISSFFARRNLYNPKSFSPSLSSEASQRISLRQGRQYTTTCTDRITMPCIVEDFIAAGMGNVIDCSPIHCGNQFCTNGVLPCRIESTVTPFGIGIHFGDGQYKGSPEENIGACLKYSQVGCVV